MSLVVIKIAPQAKIFAIRFILTPRIALKLEKRPPIPVKNLLLGGWETNNELVLGSSWHRGRIKNKCFTVFCKICACGAQLHTV